MNQTRLDVLGQAMLALSGDVVSDDGVASAAIFEAGQRLRQLHADLCVVLPALGNTVVVANMRPAQRKAFMAAHNRLALEVLA